MRARIKKGRRRSVYKKEIEDEKHENENTGRVPLIPLDTP